MAKPAAVRVLIEETKPKSIASALDWPGWARSGKTPEAAVEELLDYGDRYARIASRVGVAISGSNSAEVIATVAGSSGTTFGAPVAMCDVDFEPLVKAERSRWVALTRAAWEELDDAANEAPAELPKGPRGGGRDRDDIVRHVVEAERSYGPKFGIRLPVLPKTFLVPTEVIATQRGMIIDAIAAFDESASTAWPLRYALRRLVWHTVDHAWELQDKSL
jgi:hypothetical protein